MKDHLTALVEQALQTLRDQNEDWPGELRPQVRFERTRDREHGDWATNIAMTLAKPLRKSPREIAGALLDALPPSPSVAKAEIAGPGFINFFLNETAATQVVSEILARGETFGHGNTAAGQRIQVEYVSANPTGPLHVGHGRGAAIGDSICRLLEAQGADITREFYYNDAGAQIDNLALSVQARCKGIVPDAADWPQDGYRGEYIVDLANAYLAGEAVHAEDRDVTAAGDPEDLEAIRAFAVAFLRREQDLDLKAFGVDFDVYFLESSLYADGKVDAAVEKLIDSGHTYESDGALWLKTTAFGDDKDRVMRKREGGYTYFVPDVAYHLDKWQRGFDRVINEQGADHHSTITRVRAGLQALDVGVPEGWPDYVLHQMVLVMRGGEEVKLSKRAGSYVTLRDLIDEVGRDATRYFLCARAANAQLTFDIDLAISRSNDNPVYYIQYAHARICSMFRKLAEQGMTWSAQTGAATLDSLGEEAEKALLRRLAAYPDAMQTAAEQFAPHTIANYLRELAGEFHSWYNGHKVLVDDPAIRDARLALSRAVQQVLANGLNMLGVSAPESM